MRIQQLGNSDLHVSAVALGTWPMGGTTYGAVDDNESIATIHAALDSGINIIDTAPAYGNGRAETVVGKAIKGRRDSVVVATKVGVTRSPEGERRPLTQEVIREEIEKSLRHLNVDYIDLYQIHWPDRSTPIAETIEGLLTLQKEGKFRYLGVSNFDTQLMDQVLNATNLVSLQPPYSLLDREIETEILPYCRNHNIGVLTYGPLASGILAGKFKGKPELPPNDTRHTFYPYFQEPIWSKAMELVEVLETIATKYNRPIAHVAINWVTQQPGVTTALVGARHPEQAKTNAVAGTWRLHKEDLETIEQKYQQIFSK